MAYSDDLLAQASRLAAADRRKPKQVNLRRAISAAYYALFHAIVDRSVTAVLSGSEASGLTGSRLRRTVAHTSVFRAAKWFLPGSTPPGAVQAMRTKPGSPPLAVGSSLMSVCRRFTELQEARHRADYDLSIPFDRADALVLIASAQSALRELRALDDKGDTLIFLLGCLFGDSLTKNS